MRMKSLSYLIDDKWDSEDLQKITQIVRVRSAFFEVLYEIERCTTSGEIMKVDLKEVISDDTELSLGYFILKECAFSDPMIESINLDQQLFDMDEGAYFPYQIPRGVLREIDYKYLWSDEPYFLLYQLEENIVC